MIEPNTPKRRPVDTENLVRRELPGKRIRIEHVKHLYLEDIRYLVESLDATCDEVTMHNTEYIELSPKNLDRVTEDVLRDLTIESREPRVLIEIEVRSGITIRTFEDDPESLALFQKFSSKFSASKMTRFMHGDLLFLSIPLLGFLTIISSILISLFTDSGERLNWWQSTIFLVPAVVTFLALAISLMRAGSRNDYTGVIPKPRDMARKSTMWREHFIQALISILAVVVAFLLGKFWGS